MSLTILTGDALDKLRELPAESVQCCVTSPPYWGLRDYGTAAWEGGDAGCDHVERNGRNGVSVEALARRAELYGTGQQSGSKVATIQFSHECGKCGARRIDSQLGLERTPEEYVTRLVKVFREVRRVLRRDGTLWLNLGDSYAGGLGGRGDSGNEISRADGTTGRTSQKHNGVRLPRDTPGLKSKDLCGIPWCVAFALQADGWWLRSDIIWSKPNPMPESVTDRPTKAHEYLFLLTKASAYYYDAEAIKEPMTGHGSKWRNGKSISDADNGPKHLEKTRIGFHGTGGFIHGPNPNGANKRSVWTVATAPYPESHFATFPPDLIKPCIMAGTSAKGCCAKCGAPWERVVDVSYTDAHRGMVGNQRKEITDDRVMHAGREDDKRMNKNVKTLGWQPSCRCQRSEVSNHTEPCTVLDPFAGSGTTGAVALELGRKAVLIELNPAYVKLIEQRCDVTPGLALA